MALIIFNAARLLAHHFHTGENIRFLGMMWYWHFVDVVWVIIWPLVYVWGRWGYYKYRGWAPLTIYLNSEWGTSLG